MKNRHRILVIILSLTTGLSAQQVPVPSKDTASGPVIGERDKAKEDLVAKQFDTIRAGAKLRTMTRIKHRASLEQTICTIALNRMPKERQISAISTVYRTAQFESIPTELRKLATMEDFHFSNKSDFVRYSVAVWRVRDSQSGEANYWVGVQLYWDAAAEFFEEHFTDDMYWRNDWKKQIAPECRGK